ncbi:MAG: CHASE domain-containing protein [Magnetococcales bacterium]|nr:CHASE domain-containing protein [Magnetococcales bacterium]MBF0115563.1 CHASE domain-containing protein [Magnetococcales bacterium]
MSEPDSALHAFFKAYGASLAVVCIGLVLSVLSFVQVKGQIDASASREFEWLAHDRGNVLQKDIKDIISNVELFGELMDFKLTPSSDEFQHFAKHMIKYANGLVTLQWIIPVRDDRRDFFEKQWKQHITDFTILEEDVQGSNKLALSRSTYFPIIFSESLLGSVPHVGFDYGSKPAYRLVLERVMATRRTAISTALEYVTAEGAIQKYFIFATPRLTGVHPNTQVTGIALATFVLSDLATYSVSYLEPRGVDFLILDETEPAQPELVEFYHSRLESHAKNSVTKQNWRDWLQHQTMKVQESFQVADRRWQLTFAPASHTKTGEGFPNGPMIVFVGGILFTLSLAIFVAVTNQNLKERKQLYEIVKQSESKLRALLHQSPDTIFTVNEKGKLSFVNRSKDEIFENASDHCLGCLSYSEQGSLQHDAIRAVFQNGHLEQFQCSDSESKWCEIRFVPIRVDDRVSEVMVLVTDISEKRRMENQTTQQARLASLGVLAAGVAHEINNPNNAVLFNIAVLQRGWPEIETVVRRHVAESSGLVIGGLAAEKSLDVFPKLLESIKNNAYRITSIVNSLKHLAKPDPGEMHHEVQIHEVIRHSLSIIQHQIKRYTDHFHLELPEHLPLVRGNTHQLEQVILNLLLNALQSLSVRSASVTLAVTVGLERNELQIRVSDEGKGINPENVNQIFKPFYTTRPENGGLGLGLSITHNIVIAHQGRIEVASTPGKGTTMLVLLPIIKSLINQERC